MTHNRINEIFSYSFLQTLLVPPISCTTIRFATVSYKCINVAIQQNDDDRLNKDMHEEVKSADRHDNHSPDLPKILETFEGTWNGSLWLRNISRHRIKPAFDDGLSMHSTHCRAWTVASHIVVSSIDESMEKDTIKLVTTVWSCLIVFAAKKTVCSNSVSTTKCWSPRKSEKYIFFSVSTGVLFRW